jgi:type I restriction enzyme S subunit
MTGTAGQKRVPASFVEGLEIPVPLNSEQKRIAAILEKADRLRRTRRYARQLSDTFLQSVFIEMFGDPIKNPKGWSRASLADLGRVVTGSTPPSIKQGMFGGAIPFVTPGDLEVDTSKTMRFVSDAGAKRSRLVRKGSTLVCCIGATIGKTDQAQTQSAFNQQINAVEWNANVDDDYGLQVMRFFSTEVAARGRSTTLPILKKSEFEEMAVPVPPLPLQQKFAAIVRRFERLRAQQREAERQAEHLFQTLLHRAFNSSG